MKQERSADKNSHIVNQFISREKSLLRRVRALGEFKKNYRAPILAAVCLVGFSAADSAHSQILGTAESYAVLGGSTVTNTGPSVITGDVGASPGNAIVGFPPGVIIPPGVIHAGDADAQLAQNDLTTAYNSLMGRPSDVDLTGQDLGGLVLSPAVYSFVSSAQLTGVLTLDGQGNTAGEFIFQIGSALTTASNSAVLLINGANANNVYWAVGSSATLGTNTVFAGNIVALTSITLNTGASIICGRALARNGAVTLDNNRITLCVADDGGGDDGGGDDGGGDDGGGDDGGGDDDNDIPVDDLGGGGVSGAQQTALAASNLFNSAIASQAARDGAGQPAQQQPYRSLKDAPSGAGFDGYADERPPLSRQLWATGFAGSGSIDDRGRNGPGGLDNRTAGFAAGLDHRIDQNFLVGIAVGYTNSDFSVDERSTHGTVEGVHVALYGVKTFGAFYLSGSAQYAHFDNRTQRTIDWVIDERAFGEFSSEEISGRLEAGWKRSVGRHTVTPFAGIAVARLNSDGFTEDSFRLNGAPGILGLTFESDSVTSVKSSLGVQFDTRIALADGRTLTPFARIAWVHEFNPERSIDSSLTLSPAATFSLDGVNAPSDLAKITAGVRLDVNENFGVFAAFDGEFSGESESYSGSGGFRISW